MTLVPMKKLLEDATRENKAVAAINVSNMETIMGLLEIACKMNEAVIVQVAPIQLEMQNITYEQFVSMVKLFNRSYDFEIAIHLDHATKVEDCFKAIDAGFTSVMYDGSQISYEENKINTTKVVEYAVCLGVTVEAELGKVGGQEGENEVCDDKSHLTDPDQVKDFVTATNVDCLAVAIGNAHGLYKSAPNLDFERLSAIQEIGGIPLVLHGGTGISPDDLDRAISKGIRKINFFTEIDRAYVKGFINAYNDNSSIYMMAAQEQARQFMMNEIEQKIRVCRRK